MLSRIAESMYWIGRYLERAEDTARVIDVHIQLMVEHSDADVENTYQALFRSLGILNGPPTTDTDALTALMIFNEDFPGSIAHSIGAAWDNARGAREVLSSEFWECLNITRRMCTDWDRRASPHELLSSVKERAAVAAGLVEVTMSRDEGWRFLVLGRSIERADMTTRLLSARHGDRLGLSGWRVLLRSCAAHEAFLRRYRGQFAAEQALEFLLIDAEFPRSVLSSLREAGNCLTEIDRVTNHAEPASGIHRTLARTASDLSYATSSELADDLEQQLSRLEQVCALTHAAITGRYFRVTAPIEWTA